MGAGKESDYEESNLYELPCVALLNGPVREPANRRGLSDKGGLLGPRFICC